MAETYEIKYGDAPVGTAQMERQGLYANFSCRCRLPESGMFRIHAICGENREDLGICIPMGDAFGMDKKIPAKRMGVGELSFELVPKDWKPQEDATSEPAESVVEEEKIPEPEEEPFIPEPEEEPFIPASGEETFIPVSEGEPFEHLDKLENAVMEVRDDQTGIVIQE